MSESEALDLLGDRLELIKSKPPSTSRASDAAFLLENLMKRQGFQTPDVKPIISGNAIRLVVNEGPRIKIGSVAVPGFEEKEQERLSKLFKLPGQERVLRPGQEPPFREADVAEGLSLLEADFRSRGYWKAKYASPDLMLVNIQGPTEAGGPPHVDGTYFRGLNYDNTPTWLIGLMTKCGLFRQWQAKKAQVLTWYYKGSIGGGFTYWPDGPDGQPKQLNAPMWGRAAVVENEVMYHGANACGPQEMRRPEGLAITSAIEADPQSDGWQITTDGKVIQRLPAEETRLLVHWGADIFMDMDEMKVTLDHTDDLTHERVFDVLFSDMKKRGEAFTMPTDPLNDPALVQLLTKIYDPGRPTIMPPEYGLAVA